MPTSTCAPVHTCAHIHANTLTSKHNTHTQVIAAGEQSVFFEGVAPGNLTTLSERPHIREYTVSTTGLTELKKEKRTRRWMTKDRVDLGRAWGTVNTLRTCRMPFPN